MEKIHQALNPDHHDCNYLFHYGSIDLIYKIIILSNKFHIFLQALMLNVQNAMKVNK